MGCPELARVVQLAKNRGHPGSRCPAGWLWWACRPCNLPTIPLTLPFTAPARPSQLGPMSSVELQGPQDTSPQLRFCPAGGSCHRGKLAALGDNKLGRFIISACQPRPGWLPGAHPRESYTGLEPGLHKRAGWPGLEHLSRDRGEKWMDCDPQVTWSWECPYLDPSFFHGECEGWGAHKPFSMSRRVEEKPT